MRAVFTISILLILQAAALAKPAKPASQPAAEPDGLSVIAADAIEQNELAKLKAEIDEPLGTLIEQFLADPAKADLAHLTRLAALREMTKYFARIEKPTENQSGALRFLAQQPRLLSTVMMAVGSKDAPDRVLPVLQVLRKDHKDSLDDFADLAAAFCVVWDDPVKRMTGNDEDDIDFERISKRFKFYVKQKDKLRFDTSELPWQLAVYVVDNPVQDDEIKWVLDKYERRASIGSVFFEVPYDKDHYRKGEPKKIDEHEYTLPNLKQFGGVCADQAYYATNVAKCLGVPAAYCRGIGGGGEMGHAWVGYLDVRGKDVLWNFKEGRYKEHLYWYADITDPQTHETISDAEVGILAELQNSTRVNRLASIALCKSADLIEGPDVLNLYIQTIELSPGNRDAWYAIAQLGADGKLAPDQMNEFMKVVEKFAVKNYAEFAFAISQKLISGRDAKERITALEAVVKMFRGRPDLVAQARIAQGDVLHTQARDDDAMTAYGDVLTNYLNAGPPILVAMSRVDAMLRESRNEKRLAAIYDQVWNKVPKPNKSAYVTATPYHVIGTQYATLLEELGDKTKAANVKSRLESFDSGED